MEQRFMDSISDDQQEHAAEMTRKLKRDAAIRAGRENGKTREDIKEGYARKLAARLAKAST